MLHTKKNTHFFIQREPASKEVVDSWHIILRLVAEYLDVMGSFCTVTLIEVKDEQWGELKVQVFL